MMAPLPTPLALSKPPMAAASPSLSLYLYLSPPSHLSAIGTSNGGAASHLATYPAAGSPSGIGLPLATASSRHRRLSQLGNDRPCQDCPPGRFSFKLTKRSHRSSRSVCGTCIWEPSTFPIQF